MTPVKREFFAGKGYCILAIIILFIVYPAIGCCEVVLDGTLGQSGSLAGPDYIISDDLGRQEGGNLFHSFSDFNIYTDESAIFTGPDTVDNIISRVTGGNESFIDGILRSDIEGADMFFINPSGVMFGENASLDISGSFHVSTSDYVTLGDGGLFNASAPKESIFTSADPSAFGFLGDNPGSITVEGSFLEAPEGRTLSVIGGDIRINNGYLYAPDGKINVISVGSDGEVTLGDLAAGANNFEAFREIEVTHDDSNRVEINGYEVGNIDTSGEGGGGIYIIAGKFVMNGGEVSSNSYGERNGEGIDFQIMGDMELSDESLIESSAYSTGNSGNIKIEAEEFLLKGVSSVCTSSYGEVDSGDIKMSTDTISISGNKVSWEFTPSRISSTAYGSGDAGSIDIETGELTLTDGCRIDASAVTSNGGDVSVKASSILISDYILMESFSILDYVVVEGGVYSSGIYSDVGEVGAVGSIEIETGDLTLTNLGRISAYNYGIGIGDGGDISVKADSITISGYFVTKEEDVYTSEIASSISVIGTAGGIEIETGELTLTNLGGIRADAIGLGNGGDVSIKADSISISGYIVTDYDKVYSSGITSVVYGYGDSGNIEIETGDLTLTDLGRIDASVEEDGNGGDIIIKADSITISDAIVNDDGYIFSSGIKSATYGFGDAGSIEIETGDLILIDGGQITTSSQGGEGMGGDIFVKADTIFISGGVVTDEKNFLKRSISLSGIKSDTFGDGDAGNIEIETRDLILTDGGVIDTSSHKDGEGKGGNISIKADSITLTGYMVISEEFGYVLGSSIQNYVFGSGGTGEIVIETEELILSDGGHISAGSSWGESRGGDIFITADSIFISNSVFSEIGLDSISGIDSHASGGGIGGDIQIRAENLHISGEGVIDASGFGTSDAGDIEIEVYNKLTIEDSTVSTSAKEAAGGNITITGEDIQLLDNSEITASVASGEGGGGNVTINADTLVSFDNSDITAYADEGYGGNITIHAEVVFFSDDIDLDASSNIEGQEGSVEINSPVIDISGSMTVLPESFMDAKQMFPSQCSARSMKDMNSFTISGRDGLSYFPHQLMESY